MTLNNTLTLDKQHVWHPFTQAKTAPVPLAIQRAEGVHLYAEDGKQYIDLIASWWVNLHGHCHPEIVAAISQQAATLEQVVFADIAHAPASILAERLCVALNKTNEYTNFRPQFNRVFYSDDGSTAVEVAMKMALQYFHNKGESRPKLLAFEGAYHGDTAGAMSAAAAMDFSAYKSLLCPIEKIPYPHTGVENVAAAETKSLELLETALAKKDVAALLIEPLVQGASGMRMASKAWLDDVVGVCQRYNTLVIFDEVMVGFSRTNSGDGTIFAFQQLQNSPDIICLAKGITGGFLPLSATVCSEALYEVFLDESFTKSLIHGHSYTANPIGCAAGIKSLEILQRAATQQQIAAITKTHQIALKQLPNNCYNPRQYGTIAAFDVTSNNPGYTAKIGPILKKAFIDNGLLLRPLGNTVYFMPPYCISAELLGRCWQQALEIVESQR